MRWWWWKNWKWFDSLHGLMIFTFCSCRSCKFKIKKSFTWIFLFGRKVSEMVKKNLFQIFFSHIYQKRNHLFLLSRLYGVCHYETIFVVVFPRDFVVIGLSIIFFSLDVIFNFGVWSFLFWRENMFLTRKHSILLFGNWKEVRRDKY